MASAFRTRGVCDLEGQGFVLVRQRGSHMIMQRKVSRGTTTVPVPNDRELAIGTLRAIVRQSGVEAHLFQAG